MDRPQLTLDIGGEGRHPGAVNLNLSRYKTLGTERGQPIPNLVVARADALPFADGSVTRVIVERTPLGQKALKEIARVIAAGGTIELLHVPLPDTDRHAQACALLPGVVQRSLQQIAGQAVQETRFLVPGERS